jgi:hypothetical protein
MAVQTAIKKKKNKDASDFYCTHILNLLWIVTLNLPFFSLLKKSIDMVLRVRKFFHHDTFFIFKFQPKTNLFTYLMHNAMTLMSIKEKKNLGPRLSSHFMILMRSEFTTLPPKMGKKHI